MWWEIDQTEEGIRERSARELLARALPLFKTEQKHLLIAVGLLVIVTGAELAGPLVLQHIIDVSIPAGDSREVMYAAGLYVGLRGVGAWSGYQQSMTLFRMGINIVSELKHRLFSHVLKLGLDFHDDYSPGKLISRVESDTETLKELFGEVAVNVLRNLFVFIGILTVLLWKDLYLGAVVVAFVPVLFAMTFAFVTWMKRYWREVRAQWALVTGYVTEYVQGVDVIQQFNYQQEADSRMKEVNQEKFDVQARTHLIDNSFWAGFSFMEIVIIVVLLLVGVGGIAEGTITLGLLVMFIEYIRKMFQPLRQLSGQINFIQRGLISAERVFDLLDTEPDVQDGPRGAGELSFEHSIKFENVWFAYEDEDWVLKNVSFELGKGEQVALAGESGGGKSTIVKLLLRFYDPQRGKITVDGVDIREFPVTAWREHLGLVLQDIYLFPGTVGDNIRVFNDEIPQEDVERVSEITHADEVVEGLPGGFEGELNERGSNLSVGECQLISFARALAYDPPVLVLDEATSSVDPHTEELVQDALEELLEGRTSLIVAHRLSTILASDRILLVHEGEIAERGSHEELLELDGLYANLYRLQFAADPAAVGGGGQ